MVIIDKGNFLIIPVYHKEWKKIIQIKGFRFNPEIHEHLGNEAVTEKKEKIVITTEDIQKLDEQIKETSVAITVDPPEVQVEEVIEPPKKRKGMPKGGWPKKKK